MPATDADENIPQPHSLAEYTQAPCPQCGQPIDIETWFVVDGAERPDLVERLGQGSLHDVTCAHCGYTGPVDAPLLLYRPDQDPPLLFSPAQTTGQEQDQRHAAALVGWLRERLGDAWQEGWLADGLTGVPRQFLPAALSDDPEAAVRRMQAEAAAALEQLWEGASEAYAELEAALQQMSDNDIAIPANLESDAAAVETLADQLNAWMQHETLAEAESYLHAHEAELLTDEAQMVLEMLQQDNPDDPAILPHQVLLARCLEIGIRPAYQEIET
jgi:hypothetical protein